MLYHFLNNSMIQIELLVVQILLGWMNISPLSTSTTLETIVKFYDVIFTDYRRTILEACKVVGQSFLSLKNSKQVRHDPNFISNIKLVMNCEFTI